MRSVIDAVTWALKADIQTDGAKVVLIALIVDAAHKGGHRNTADAVSGVRDRIGMISEETVRKRLAALEAEGFITSLPTITMEG